MERWEVYVEKDGQVVESAVYGSLAAAQMAAEAKRLYWYYHIALLQNVVVGIMEV